MNTPAASRPELPRIRADICDAGPQCARQEPPRAQRAYNRPMDDAHPDARHDDIPRPTDDHASMWTAADERRLFHEGMELFNDGQWFEAHEVWEDIWHMAGGPRKRFYQGLIQCAVTLEHVRRGNPRGVRTVWTSARSKFAGLPQVYRGVNVKALLTGVGGAIARILELPDEYFDPARPRGQMLPFNPADVPRLTLEYDPFADDAA